MQHLLTHGTVDDVRVEIRRYYDVLGPGGGCILGPAHLLQPDVPPEHILAVYQGDSQLAWLLEACWVALTSD